MRRVLVDRGSKIVVVIVVAAIVLPKDILQAYTLHIQALVFFAVRSIQDGFNIVIHASCCRVRSHSRSSCQACNLHWQQRLLQI